LNSPHSKGVNKYKKLEKQNVDVYDIMISDDLKRFKNENKNKKEKLKNDQQEWAAYLKK